MSSPNTTFNDGLIPHSLPLGGSSLAGVFQVQRNGAALGYLKFESLNLVNPTVSTNQKNPDGTPFGSFDVIDFDTFTARVQIPSATGPFILRGDYISETLFPGSASVLTYRVTEHSTPYEMEGYWKQETTWKRVYNDGHYATSAFTSNSQ